MNTPVSTLEEARALVEEARTYILEHGWARCLEDGRGVCAIGALNRVRQVTKFDNLKSATSDVRIASRQDPVFVEAVRELSVGLPPSRMQDYYPSDPYDQAFESVVQFNDEHFVEAPVLDLFDRAAMRLKERAANGD